MAEQTRVHVIRHGEVHNPTGVLYGRLPGFRLTELGEQMAVRAAEVLEHRDVTVVVSSPLERAQQTAAPVAAKHDLRVSIDDRIVEASNVFEGSRVGVGDGVGAGLDVGSGVATGVGLGVCVGSGLGLGLGVGVGSELGVGLTVGSTVGIGVGSGVGVGDGPGVPVGDGIGVRLGVGAVLGLGVGVGVGTGGLASAWGTGEDVTTQSEALSFVSIEFPCAPPGRRSIELPAGGAGAGAVST